jgi:thioredoxin reductase (NADPH)
VLIATGADYRKLDVPGREQLEGSGVYYAATHVEAQLCRGSQGIVIGGGNSAGQGAMYLSEQTPKVFLLIRDGDLRKTMSNYLVERLEKAANIEVLAETEISRMLGDGWLEAVETTNRRTGEKRTIQTPAVFTFIGAIPFTDWLPAAIEKDPKGFVKTGRSVSASLDCKARTALPRDQPSRRLRRRRRAIRFDQASRLGSRRGRNGRPVRT